MSSALLRDVMRDAIAATRDEVGALRDGAASTLDLRSGRPVGVVEGEWMWSFELDSEVSVLPETRGLLMLENREPVSASVVAIGDLDLVIAVRENLGESMAEVRLSLEPWFIYEELSNRLAEFLQMSSDEGCLEELLELSEATDGEQSDVIAGASEEDTEPDLQSRAVSLATRDGVHFVWGPPGTGKTKVLAETVSTLALNGKRVLVLSHANAAVDVAMVRVARELPDDPLLADGEILRLGPSQSEDVAELGMLLPAQIVAHRHPELAQRRSALETSRRRLSSDLKHASSKAEETLLSAELSEVRSELKQIDVRVRQLENELLGGATIVGATLSRLVLSQALWEWPADAVIVDEASMAPIPFLLAIAARGPATLTFFGDFRQLPPVTTSKTQLAKAWLGRDIFEVAGVIQKVEHGQPDGRVAMLRTQYRMGESIGDAVSRFAYFGLLHTDRHAADRAVGLAECEPSPGDQIVLVDLSELGAPSQQEATLRSFSRFNLLSAALASTLAATVSGTFALDVGIVTPYRAQAQILAALNRGNSSVTAATTHRFQGSERDAIIVDLVDAPPLDGPSQLTGMNADLTKRLMNVGVSRARGKLVLVADLEFVEGHHPRSSPVREFIEISRDLGAVSIGAGRLMVGEVSNVAWRSSFPSALEAVLAGAPPTATCELSLYGEHASNEVLRELVERECRAGRRVVVHASSETLSRLESSSAELQLLPLGAGPLALVGDLGVVVGADAPDGGAALIRGVSSVHTIRRLLRPIG